ncbi:endonuclease/exonuclease/phosphatase family protein [Celeribacter sp.]|uniref:endonuclease/exonuclease/phosphatase family protein n=1 Tax=Celeribacter sp. TaxID=1890673 RepID=UPI003A8EEF79
MAFWSVELERRGPGLLLHDIRKGTDPDLLVARDAIRQLDADVILLSGVDTDYDGYTVDALAHFLDAGYDFTFTEMGNTGAPSGFDIDRDGRLGEAEDALAFGRFRGEGGMALLSRHPIAHEAIVTLTDLKWRDVPDTRLPYTYFSPAEAELLTVSSRGHWMVPVEIGGIPLTVLAFHATTPVFDGDEDRNGRRGADEVALIRHILNGRIGEAPEGTFVVMGSTNIDPVDGEGIHGEVRALLAHPLLQDPLPRSTFGPAPNGDQKGDPTLDTADWRDPDPGNLRVDYVLPSRDLDVLDTGLEWVDGPEDGPFHHAVVWVDLVPFP